MCVAFTASAFAASAFLPPPPRLLSHRPQFASYPPSPQCCASTTTYTIQVVNAMKDFGRDEWNFFARQGSSSPFLEYTWLSALEEGACVTQDSGWIPRHLALRDPATSTLLALAPSYVKLNSLGEFVFDQNFADASYSVGEPYYPKLLIGIPFTPAGGRRILTISDERRPDLLPVFARAVVQLCGTMELSSAHVNFCEKDEAQAFAAAGYFHRLGVQYHWSNEGFQDFNHFLMDKFKSKRRITLKRERKKVLEQGVHIEVLAGDDVGLKEIIDIGYECYVAGIEKQWLYGRQYISREFFELLGSDAEFRKNIVLVVARDSDGEILAGTFNIVGGSDPKTSLPTFYGRYWGSPSEMRGNAPIAGLHFETCYYASLEYAIGAGVGRVEPGAGSGDSKGPRGFAPSETHSVHWFKNRQLGAAIGNYIEMESSHVEGIVNGTLQD